MFKAAKLIQLKLFLYVVILLLFLSDIADEQLFAAMSIPGDFEEYYNNGLLVLLLLSAVLLLVIEKRITKKMREQEKHYRDLIEISPDVIVIYQNQKIVFMNEPGVNMLEASHFEEIKGKDLLEFMPPKYQKIFSRRLKHVMETGELLPSQEFRMITFTKKNLSVKVRETFMTFDDKPAVMVVIKNITKSRTLEKTINHITYNDALTNLPNRKALKHDLDTIIYSAQENQTSFAVLIINMQRFRTINDSLGHAVGDIVLKLIAERLKKTNGSNTNIYRVGGNEFAIIVPGINGEADIIEFCQQVFEGFKHSFKIGDHKLKLLPSVGAAMYPKNGHTSDELLRQADIAIHYEKKQGNGMQIYEESMEKEYIERLLVEEELPKAIDSNEFQLHYQPKVNSLTQEIIGVEALIRWNSSKLGFVPPLTFIPIAEETDMIQPISEWVLQTACRQAKAWEVQSRVPVSVAINVSPKHLEQENFVEMVAKTLEETGLEGSLLQIEITETAMMSHLETASQILEELKGLGIKVAIDDFGTGFSSLNYLSKLPIDVLKIDRSFVGSLETYDNQVIVKTIIALGQSLQLEVVAEGVETKEQADFLQANGCCQVQGYLFGKPSPANEVAKMIIPPANGL